MTSMDSDVDFIVKHPADNEDLRSQQVHLFLVVSAVFYPLALCVMLILLMNCTADIGSIKQTSRVGWAAGGGETLLWGR